VGTCDTCKHWDKAYHNLPKLGRCGFVTSWEDRQDDDLFTAEQCSDQCGAGYDPDIITGPKFGCIHHEVKHGGN
jgi:hypothetical protein